MSYNIQQGVDGKAERAWAEQLELIRQVDPDLLALQESDSARISLGNDDLRPPLRRGARLPLLLRPERRGGDLRDGPPLALPPRGSRGLL